MIHRDFSRPASKEWDKRVVILWEEDDATRQDPTAEKPQQAFERITKRRYDQHEVIEHLDMGDGFMNLTRWGWVLGYTCDGGFVGMLTKPQDR